MFLCVLLSKAVRGDPSPMKVFTCPEYQNFYRAYRTNGDLNAKKIMDSVVMEGFWRFDCITINKVSHGRFVKIHAHGYSNRSVYANIFFYTQDAEEDPPTVCFEILKVVAGVRSSYFECMSESDTTASYDERLRKLMASPMEKTVNTLDALDMEVSQNTLKLEDVRQMLKDALKEFGEDGVQIGEFKHIDKVDSVEGERTIETFHFRVAEADGLYFYVRFTKLPYIIWKVVIYNATPDFIKLEVRNIYENHELFIQRIISPTTTKTQEELIAEKYYEDIKKMFTGVTSAKETPISMPQELNIYQAADHTSFTVIVGLVDWILSSPDKYNYEKLELPTETSNYHSIPSIEYFYIRDEERFETVKSLGTIFNHLPIHQIPAFKKLDDTFVTTMQRVHAAYLKSAKSTYTMSYGITQYHRKFFLKIFNFEDASYKGFLLQFITPYFDSQSLIAYDNFKTVIANTESVIKEFIDHFAQVIVGSEKIQLKPAPLQPEKIYDMIIALVKKYDLPMCADVTPTKQIAKSPEILIRLRTVRKFKLDQFADDNQAETMLAPGFSCTNKYRESIMLRKRRLDGKSGYELQIAETERTIKEDKEEKIMRSSYKFYAQYPYDYMPILQKYLESILSHYTTGQYKREDDHTKALEKIFSTPKPDFAEDKKNWETLQAGKREL